MLERGAFNLPGLWSGDLELPLARPEAPTLTTLQRSPGEWMLALFLILARAIAVTAGFGALALVVSLLWPGAIERMGRAGVSAPWMALAVGLLTWVVGVALIGLLAITLCLLPLALLLALALTVVGMLAWIVSGWWIGSRVFGLARLSPGVVVETTLGTVALVALFFLLAILPCVEFFYGCLVVFFGTGAIVLTRFGRRSYPTSLPALPVASPPSATTPDSDRDLLTGGH
jgi:hypothetical protein